MAGSGERHPRVSHRAVCSGDADGSDHRHRDQAGHGDHSRYKGRVQKPLPIAEPAQRPSRLPVQCPLPGPVAGRSPAVSTHTAPRRIGSGRQGPVNHAIVDGRGCLVWRRVQGVAGVASQHSKAQRNVQIDPGWLGSCRAVAVAGLDLRDSASGATLPEACAPSSLTPDRPESGLGGIDLPQVVVEIPTSRGGIECEGLSFQLCSRPSWV